MEGDFEKGEDENIDNDHIEGQKAMLNAIQKVQDGDVPTKIEDPPAEDAPVKDPPVEDI